MSIDHRGPTSDHGAARSDIQRHVTLSFDGDQADVLGTIRGISSHGALFLSQSRMALPDLVMLQFGNGEAFECAVDQRGDETEFVLRFTDAPGFDKSQIRECMDRVKEFKENRSPVKICDHMEEVNFFGDEEILDLMERCVNTYEEFMQICSERLFPS